MGIESNFVELWERKYIPLTRNHRTWNSGTCTPRRVHNQEENGGMLYLWAALNTEHTEKRV